MQSSQTSKVVKKSTSAGFSLIQLVAAYNNQFKNADLKDSSVKISFRPYNKERLDKKQEKAKNPKKEI